MRAGCSFVLLCCLLVGPVGGQVPDTPESENAAWLAKQIGADPLATDTIDEDLGQAELDGAELSKAVQPDQLNILWLVSRGGPLMVVLGVLSVAMIGISIDRWFAVRTRQIMPTGLMIGLGELTEARGGFDPRAAYRLCQDYPSPTSTVLRAMLLKVGRPQSEVEHTASEAAQREAARLYGRVRWLTVIATISPLIGLLGTVWGLIQAFYETTRLSAEQSRADYLAGGIYEALVTTLGGLVVAVPAAILAHYFEGSIERTFYRIDELLLNLAPHVERFEGRVRVGNPVHNPPDGDPDPDGDQTQQTPVEQTPVVQTQKPEVTRDPVS